MKSVISEKGQVTIPKALRDQFGIRPGQLLEFAEEAGRIVVTKANESDPLDALFGVLPQDEGTDSFIASMRGEPDAV